MSRMRAAFSSSLSHREKLPVLQDALTGLHTWCERRSWPGRLVRDVWSTGFREGQSVLAVLEVLRAGARLALTL